MWAILDRTWAISGGAGMWAMQAAKELMWAFIAAGAVECGQFGAAVCRANVGNHWWCCGMWAI